MWGKETEAIEWAVSTVKSEKTEKLVNQALTVLHTIFVGIKQRNQ